MRIKLELEMDEADYIAILRASSFKMISTEDFIKQAIREQLNKIADEIGFIPQPKQQDENP